MSENVLQYLIRKGWEYSETGDQYNVIECPFCHDTKKHFYINQDNGAWDCKKCFLGDTPILTKEGYKNIKDIKIGDFVLTKNGIFNKVKDVIVKNYTGEMIGITNNQKDTIWTTPDHIIFFYKNNKCIHKSRRNRNCLLCSKNCHNKQKFSDLQLREEKAQNINKNYFLHTPKVKTFSDINIKSLLEWIYPINNYGPKIIIPEGFYNDVCFQKLIGFYVANGSIITRGINIAYNTVKNKKSIDEIKTYLEKYNLRYTIYENGLSGVLQLYNKEISDNFNRCFGKRAENKKFGKKLLFDKKIFNIFSAYHECDGDYNGNSTVSKQLLEEIKIINLFVFNKQISCSTSKEYIDKNNVHHQEFYKVIVNKKESSFAKITNIEKKNFKNVKVFDLSVENEHNYVVNNFLVHNCGSHGNFSQLLSQLGDFNEITSSSNLLLKKAKPLDKQLNDQYIENLKNDKDAFNYLLGRGFTPETINHFKLGCDNEWITIPHFQDSLLWNIKKRNYIQKDFRRITGQPSVLFNVDGLDLKKNTLLITECETDCIAAWQMGIKNVLGLTVGADTFLPEWLPLIQKFKNIYICLDSDEAGQRGAYKIAEKIGFSKCKNIKLPTKDLNEFLQKQGPSKLMDYIKGAEYFTMKNVSSIGDYVKELDPWLNGEGSISGMDIPFPNLNNKLNGFKAEDLIILSGDAAVGKTSYTLNLIHNFAKNGKKCLGFFLEGKILYYIMRMMSIETKKPYKELRNDTVEWENVKNNFSEYPMYFYSGSQADLDPAKLKEVLQAAVKLYDIDFVMIDNLQKFVRPDKDVVNKTANAVSVLKDLAVDLKIPILLIAHITKMEKDQKRVTMHDAKFSSTIYQDADVYLTIWNNKKEKDIEDNIILTIEKNRMGEGGIDIPVVFEKDICLYHERVLELEPVKNSENSAKKVNKHKAFALEGLETEID